MNHRSLFLAGVLALSTATLPAATLTVTTTNNYLPDGVTIAPNSLLEALETAGDADTIKFNIPGTGPFVIATPQSGYPLITVNDLTIDGYTQPGATPNTHSILAGNNARLQIVLDSSTGPGQRTLLGPLNNPGFGDSESAILAFLGAQNPTVRGLSFLSRHTDESDTDPDIYCVALANDSTGARLQGCWFGLAPDGQTVSGGRSAVASFKGDGGTQSSGLVFGTDGDGVNDVAEFNVCVGLALAIHLETSNVKVSGNYINVFPDGLTFFDTQGLANDKGIDVEAIENGEGHNMVIGTDGDGISDANERNVIAHSVYDRTVELWGAKATNVVIAGNYFGVGIDGVTPSPVPTNASPDFVQIKQQGSIRIGSNGDGISDNLEGNLIVGTPGDRFVDATGTQNATTITQVTVRGNRLVNCQFAAVPFGNPSLVYAQYYSTVVEDATQAVPVIGPVANDVLSVSFAAPNAANYPYAVIDLYACDPAGLTNRHYWPSPMVHPGTWLGSYVDNGPGDLDPNQNAFAIALSTLGVSVGTYVTVAVTYSQQDGLYNAGSAVTSPMAAPVAAQPTVLMQITPDGANVEVSWLAPASTFFAEFTDSLLPASWLDMHGETYTDGRNVLLLPYDPTSQTTFYRVVSF
jgi:hypothetical protein